MYFAEIWDQNIQIYISVSYYSYCEIHILVDQDKNFIWNFSTMKPSFKGTFSWKLRWALLFVNRKLFSRSLGAHHKILILLKGHLAIYNENFSEYIIKKQWHIFWTNLDAGAVLSDNFPCFSMLVTYHYKHFTVMVYHAAAPTAQFLNTVLSFKFREISEAAYRIALNLLWSPIEWQWKCYTYGNALSHGHEFKLHLALSRLYV